MAAFEKLTGEHAVIFEQDLCIPSDAFTKEETGRLPATRSKHPNK